VDPLLASTIITYGQILSFQGLKIFT